MNTSSNGWPVIAGSSTHLWRIPTPHGLVVIPLRNGSAGFVLAHFIMWWAHRVAPVIGGVLDDWGWAPLRVERGGSAISNHCSGTAVDINATRHPLGIRGTLGALAARIRRAIHRPIYGRVLTWGGVWQRPDEMHTEISRGKGIRDTERVARRLMRTPYGRRLLAANPGQRWVILS